MLSIHTVMQITSQVSEGTLCHYLLICITGTGKLKSLIPGCKSVISAASGAEADIKLNETDRIEFGSRYLSCLFTPGHTDVRVFSYFILRLQLR